MQSVKADACLQPAKEGDQPVPGYRLVRRRGRGGFGEVWEAEAPGGFLVALKFVHLSTRCRSAELWALEVVRGIRHPNLVVSFGAWQVEDVLIVGMELADRSLGDRLLEATAQGLRGIPREELLGYLTDVASAIDYLNSDRHVLEGRNGVGLQHRDLKPQNILLFGDGAKVADFGQSRILDRGTSGGAGPCSLPYTAPECFGGKASRHSDQYSLAVTYCQLRGGHLPYDGDGDRVKAGHLAGTPDLGGLPEAERPVVARALAKRPEERWPDCQAFMTALRAQGGTATCPVPNVLTRSEVDRRLGLPAPAGGRVVRGHGHSRRFRGTLGLRRSLPGSVRARRRHGRPPDRAVRNVGPRRRSTSSAGRGLPRPPRKSRGLREGGRRAASRSPGVLGSPGPRPCSSRPRWR